MEETRSAARLKRNLTKLKEGMRQLTRSATKTSINMNVGAAAFILNRLRRIRKVGDETAIEEEIIRDGFTTDVVEKYKSAARKRWIRAIIVHISLIIALILYSFIGAAIFQALEQKTSEKELSVVDLERVKSKFLDQIWEENQNQTNKTDWLIEIDKLLTEYDTEISTAVQLGIDVENKTQHQQNVTKPGHADWDLWNSLFFAGTVYTTIGYGHLAPKTPAGKIATVIYAVIGIPLCLIVLADMGGLFSEFLKFIMRSCKKCCCRPKKKDDCKQSNEEDVEKLSGTSVIICLVVICIAYLFLGAGLYTIWEQWDYLDSFYFIFISFSTIGLGDIVPAHPRFFLLTFVYIFFGLTLLSTFLTVIQQILKSTINHATDQLDIQLGYESSSNSSVEEVRDEVTLLQISRSAEDVTNPTVES